MEYRRPQRAGPRARYLEQRSVKRLVLLPEELLGIVSTRTRGLSAANDSASRSDSLVQETSALYTAIKAEAVDDTKMDETDVVSLLNFRPR